METAEETGFIEVIFPAIEGFGIDERDEIEELLQEQLDATGWGDVSGGGSGMGVLILDVDVFEPQHLPEVVQLIRGILLEQGCPPRTRIQINQPYQEVHHI